ncbi:Unknown protein sequence, partial [Pseudomonas syringae pv. lapsa]
FPRWSVRNDNLNYRAEALRRSARTTHYRATLRVACLSGRSASSLRRKASRPAFPRWSVPNDSLNSVLKLCVGLRGQL